MFSDKYCFSVASVSSHQLLRREGETRYAQKFDCSCDRYVPGMMVWSGIMHNGRTPLQIFERESVTSQQYCGKIILDHIRIFRCAVGPDFFVYGRDNAWAHRSIEVSDTLQSKNTLLVKSLLLS
ncbi:DDE_3 domain-containing protein [Trichonephila clavipes]|nr:DDE_3 domain-containing protein [Trichonephila clavipes]